MSAAPFRRRHTHWHPEAHELLQGAIDLFLPPSVPVDTSATAACAMAAYVPTIRDAIFAQIAASKDGLTAGELEARTAYSGSTIRPRLRELEGSAPWAKGQLPARIVKTPTQRSGMRVYRTLA